MPTIGVGIIGLSAHRGWAMMAHVPALQAMPEAFSLRGLAGSNQASADSAAAKFDVPFATDDPHVLASQSDSYALLDLRGGIEGPDAKWRISVFGRNVTNEYYWQTAVRRGDAVIRFTGMPVTYGVSASYRY